MSEQTRRASRLWRLEQLIRQRPMGWTSSELARELGCSTRTVQRDIAVLESELTIPLLTDGRRYKILPGSHGLGPVRFTLQEARAMLLATRLFLRFSDDRDPDGISALEKLAGALNEPVSLHVRATIEQLKRRPQRKAQVEALRVITEGWAGSQTVHIQYRSKSAGRPKETDLDPYLLEPSAIGYTTYVVGLSHEHGAVRTFKIDRIMRAELTGRTFHYRNVAEIIERMGESWGVVFEGDEHYDIVVDFSPAVADRIRETGWHPSQRLTGLEGGGVRFEVQLPSLLEFVPWVRSWGPEARVVAPPQLVEQVATSLERAAAQYAS
jgi:CRISPR-associated endonuclease/helicase Cas3